MPDQDPEKATNGLSGHFLMAMPDMGDPRFERAVIYLHHHDEEGAVGFVINRPTAMSVPDLLDAAGSDEDFGSGSGTPSGQVGRRVGYGGPVEESRGFVLSCLADPGDKGITVDASLEALRDIVDTGKDRETMVVLGYAGWGSGQLEDEISKNVWLVGALDPTPLFHAEADNVYPLALRQIGIDLAFLSSNAGHA